MASPTPGYVKVIEAIDSFTERTGRLVAWLILPMVLGVTYEVIARYGFSAPTIWAFDLTYMLYGTIFMLGAAYALLKGAHIRTDMLWEKYSDRKKGAVDSVAYILFFFPAMLLLLWVGADAFAQSFRIGETSEQTAWRPPIWPFKGVVPLTALLLLIQGVSELLKSLHAWKTGSMLKKTEAIQI